jgi:hypothetical protein
MSNTSEAPERLHCHMDTIIFIPYILDIMVVYEMI